MFFFFFFELVQSWGARLKFRRDDMTVLEVPLNPLLFILNEVVDDIFVTNNIRVRLNPCKHKTLAF